jgi:hypothetical protein
MFVLYYYWGDVESGHMLHSDLSEGRGEGEQSFALILSSVATSTCRVF